uniref:Uncharacterized protein n=1 Tax=Anguilla anguilla TaxID=7936 RepID=A0A0E9WNR4_ANGAN
MFGSGLNLAEFSYLSVILPAQLRRQDKREQTGWANEMSTQCAHTAYGSCCSIM